MASAMNKRNTKRVRAMSTVQLQDIVRELKLQIPEATSLLDCAQKEQRRRARVITDRQSLYQKLKGPPHGDQPDESSEEGSDQGDETNQGS